MAGVYDLPDDSTRLQDKEIKGEEEYNEQLKKKNDVDNNIFEEKLQFGDDDDAEEEDQVGELPMGFKSKKKEGKVSHI